MKSEEGLTSLPGEQLYQVRLLFEEGEFVARVKPATGGVKGLLAFDATPSAFVTVMAPNPAQAVVQAWEEVRKVQAGPLIMAESQEAFAKHIVEKLKESL